MLGFAIVDNLIFFVIFSFGTIGSMRGFVKTLLSFIALFAGYALAVKTFRTVTDRCTFIPLVTTTRSIVVFFTIIIVGYLASRIIIWLLKDRVEYTLLGYSNRIFGFWIGALQGLMLVTIVTIAGMLSASSSSFQSWVSQGMISHSIAGYSYDVANDTSEPSSALQREFTTQMKSWGVDLGSLEKQHIDSKMMDEIVKLGQERPAPAMAFPPDTSLYTQLQNILGSDSLTQVQKSFEFWQKILSSQNFNIPALSPSASEHIFKKSEK